jgi:hypothetical protein
MSKFEDNLYYEITEKSSAKLLDSYLKNRSGRYFELFRPHEKKPNEITMSDLLAVTQLSMKIGGYQDSDSIPESAVIKLFDTKFQKKISKSLAKIKTTWRLETISPDDFEIFNDGIDKLWPILRDDVGLKKVATYKLMARKRPHLCPIRDSFAEKVLGHQKNWYSSWYGAFQPEIGVVAELQTLRKNCPAARHLSLLRVADIIIWERQKQK